MKIGRECLFDMFGLMIFPVLGILISMKSGDWDWFARSGAAMLAMSILAIAVAHSNREVVSVYQLIRRYMGNDFPNRELTAVLSPEFVESRNRITDTEYWTGFIGAFLGILIWGFGDLVSKI